VDNFKPDRYDILGSFQVQLQGWTAVSGILSPPWQVLMAIDTLSKNGGYIKEAKILK
jgi:hypothetical protein